MLIVTMGCATTVPTLLQIEDTATAPTKPLSDWTILRFSESLVKWWGIRSMKVEAWATGVGIGLDALTTGALAASGGGASPDIVRGLVAGVNFISSLVRRIDPGARDNAFNEGSGIVLEAQGEYMTCLTKGGNASPSERTVSPCGAGFLTKTNSAVKIVGNLMAGLMPQKQDLQNVQAVQ